MLTPDTTRLPDGFEELEPFLDHWDKPTSHERWIKRAAMPYPDILKFYEAMLPRADAATQYLDQFPLDEMPAPAERLFRLLLAMTHAAVAVEIHQAPSIRHARSQHALEIVTGFQPHG
ncbi:hypothetical protein HWD96_26295 [Pseudomonas putida]|uniref:hypothetical protein n=1 Tax=Pseudomonas TaxID=286 RepID=UPI001AE461CB|nr:MULTISPECIES: hypothetical protein [Pseudomonas]MBP2271443.1 hypothetical protein [Pseudomonas sp. BP6]MBP2289586.1 hypothetical protein [Pseudomonas sp. BP7]MCI1025729.1 hypothetical protein [Pseudomonas putida]HDS1695132.1 hypothetical protein [Pseudomonas putida]HDS1700302.1 hypothetical protein [Pseudomonas putida]